MERKGERGEEGTEGRRGACIQLPPWATADALGLAKRMAGSGQQDAWPETQPKFNTRKTMRDKKDNNNDNNNQKIN